MADDNKQGGDAKQGGELKQGVVTTGDLKRSFTDFPKPPAAAAKPAPKQEMVIESLADYPQNKPAATKPAQPAATPPKTTDKK